MATTPERRRLAPEARQAQILAAARECLAEDGVAAFSLEAVAARTGVTGPLLRHYFGSRDGLLLAAARAMLGELLAGFVQSEGQPLEDRLAAYLGHLRRMPWAQRIWMHAPEIHPEIGALVADARIRLAEISAGEEWSSMSARRRLEVIGWIGLVESTIVLWIEEGMPESARILDVLLDAARALGIDPP